MSRTIRATAHSIRPRSAAPAKNDDTAERVSTLVVVGDNKATEGICSSLSNVKATVRRIPSVKEVDREGASEALAFVWNCVDLERGFGRAVGQLQDAARIPIYAVVGDKSAPRLSRALYGAGVDGVFSWPREGLLLARYLAEMLSLRMVRGPTKHAQAALGRAVRAHLRQLPTVNFPISVVVESGRVSLAGTVEALSDRDEIEHRIAMVPGVSELDVTELIVVPFPATDNEIRRACRSILAAEVPGRTVTATADAGHVQFHGTISDRRTTQRLREMAANVRGVRGVDMDLEVSADGARRDRQTRKRLDDLIAALYSDSDLRVSFYKGVAVIEGSVNTLKRKRSVQRFVEQQATVSRVVNKLCVGI